ncbi:MAG: NapC/NirT family cytochrome c [Gammaproteobacteria bacterium]|nr:NapC/NirT family cytochrome c [Gammaproteobacteria bacterium]MBL6998419.1 NapC/NirT family cytochrome c [Gammaproteobacteria bacterium]
MLKTLKQRVYQFLAAGILLGILLWGGLHTVVEQTNSLQFCISCHEMEQTVYQEYKESIHYKNASGVRAICSDCHVPREWGPKMLRKIRASNELYHKLMGTIDTPEKFEAKRLQLAENVWNSMRKTDSRECRNCHAYEAMDFHKQRQRSAEKMQQAIEKGSKETCIDCHQGIAHKLPDGYGDDDR